MPIPSWCAMPSSTVSKVRPSKRSGVHTSCPASRSRSAASRTAGREAVGRVKEHDVHAAMVPAGSVTAPDARPVTPSGTEHTGSRRPRAVTFEGMENVLRPLIVVGGSVVLTLLLGWATDLLLRKADGRHPETPLWGLLRRCRIPYQVVLLRRPAAGLLRQRHRCSRDHRVGHRPDPDPGADRLDGLAGDPDRGRGRGDLVLPATRAPTRDPARVRRVRTQVTLIMRVVTRRSAWSPWPRCC